jgi:hypothetical protein
MQIYKLKSRVQKRFKKNKCISLYLISNKLLSEKEDF